MHFDRCQDSFEIRTNVEQNCSPFPAAQSIFASVLFIISIRNFVFYCGNTRYSSIFTFQSNIPPDRYIFFNLIEKRMESVVTIVNAAS